MGTVAYVAPEQLRGEPVDGRCDQYSLACTAFQLLVGQPPYVHPNPTVVIAHHVNSPPPSIAVHRPELAGLESVFARAMAKQPADRFRSCGGVRLSTGPAPDFCVLQRRGSVAWYAHDTQPAIDLVAAQPIRSSVMGRPGILIAAFVVIGLLIVSGVFAIVKLTGSHGTASAVTPRPSVMQSSTAAPSPNSGTAVAGYLHWGLIERTSVQQLISTVICCGCGAVIRYIRGSIGVRRVPGAWPQRRG